MSLQDLKKRALGRQFAGRLERRRFRCRGGTTPTAWASADVYALGRAS